MVGPNIAESYTNKKGRRSCAGLSHLKKRYALIMRGFISSGRAAVDDLAEEDAVEEQLVRARSSTAARPELMKPRMIKA